VPGSWRRTPAWARASSVLRVRNFDGVARPRTGGGRWSYAPTFPREPVHGCCTVPEKRAELTACSSVRASAGRRKHRHDGPTCQRCAA
jgi:hypothetical protein